MTRQRVTTALPPRERELLADLIGKVRGLVDHVGLSLGWATLQAAENVELAGFLPHTHHGAIRGTFAAGVRERDLHALETMAECVASLTLFRHDAERTLDKFGRRRIVLKDLGGAVEDLVHVGAFLERECHVEEWDGPDIAEIKAAAEPIGATVRAAAGELQAVIQAAEVRQ